METRLVILTERGTYPADGRPTAVAMGYFDGVHRGHQAVIAAAQVYARQHGLALAVFTFTSPKGKLVKGHHLLDARQKHEALADLGVEYVFEPPFESFHNLTPEAFVREMLLGEYRAKAVFCGENFGFGRARTGNVEMLRAFCAHSGTHLGIVPMAEYKGGAVSSSRIRAALAGGNIADVSAMLGYPYEVELPVVHGQRLGSRLGFPTLNQVFPPEMQAPKAGVYITQTLLEGRAWPSATGYGNRPTVSGEGDTCETFIPGFAGDLYGKTVRVRFFTRIADTQKFATPQALRDAVQNWAAQAIAYFAPTEG